ncbi:hypothetical protein SRB5_44910 [Streptomyces sp. RB5]|uniref:Uncharacterized protein n=1 Tax=Streptomyces smaragdinus TaxID=2585196 RepID=A0A7K0CLG6_9ACTN|nr:hypothetical protein [Streptomyces smaragdinus]MQY14327.1 hypothetical protein [Streptomyces smaragdinus]
MSEAGADPSVRDGINQLETYLYWQHQEERTRAETEALCAALPWLGPDERDEVARHYLTARRDLTETMRQHIACRIPQIRSEYETRYHQLRVRTVAGAAGAVPAICLAVELLRL